MYKWPVKISLAAIGIIVGVGLAYAPAMSVVADARRQVNSDNEIIDQIITLRGVIRTVDPQSQYLILQGISPYSPHESASFRINLKENTLVWSVPPMPDNKNVLILSPNFEYSTKEELTAGALAVIRVVRTAGLLQASSVVTAAHVD